MQIEGIKREYITLEVTESESFKQTIRLLQQRFKLDASMYISDEGYVVYDNFYPHGSPTEVRVREASAEDVENYALLSKLMSINLDWSK